MRFLAVLVLGIPLVILSCEFYKGLFCALEWVSPDKCDARTFVFVNPSTLRKHPALQQTPGA